MSKNVYFYVLKCREKSLLFSQTKSYYFSRFFDPNLPIFGFSRLAALDIPMQGLTEKKNL